MRVFGLPPNMMRDMCSVNIAALYSKFVRFSRQASGGVRVPLGELAF
jgi:prephenate dehydrogenase